MLNREDWIMIHEMREKGCYLRRAARARLHRGTQHPCVTTSVPSVLCAKQKARCASRRSRAGSCSRTGARSTPWWARWPTNGSTALSRRRSSSGSSRNSHTFGPCRRVALDAFIDVAGNRYSVPAHLCGERVAIHRSLDGGLKLFDTHGVSVAGHRLRPASDGRQVAPAHHARLWQEPGVQARDLACYEEAASWS